MAVDEKKKRQAFYTPSGLASYIAMKASVGGHVVLEPSAGDGAIVAACLTSGAIYVDCYEIDEVECGKIKERTRGLNVNVWNEDFLKLRHDHGEYSRIVMNPPFSLGQDLKHVAHALRFLWSGGLLVSIISGGATEEKIKKAIKWPAFEFELEEVEAGAFKESGTNVRTRILTVHT